MEHLALGLIETAGLTAAIEAADAAAKSANVLLVGYELARGGGLVTVKVRGPVSAVQAAVAAGAAAAGRVGRVISTHVIARPHPDTARMVPGHLPGERVVVAMEVLKPAPASKRSTLATAPAIEPPAEPVTEESAAEPAEEPPAEPVMEESVAETEGQETAAPDGEEVCNLCHDPACPRRRGQARRLCIQYRR